MISASPDSLSRFSFRPAGEADMPFLLALRCQSMSAHLAASGVVASEEDHLGRIRARFDCAQIVHLDGTPAGLLKVARESAVWELIQVQIATEYQGRGIGSALLRGLIGEARTAGVALDLSVLRHNPARRLYERLGFRVFASSERSYVMRLDARAWQDLPEDSGQDSRPASEHP